MFLVSATCLFLIIKVECTMVKTASVEDSFKQCLMSRQDGGLGYCLGAGAISKLRSLDAEPEFDVVDGFTLLRDEQQLREAYNFVDRNPRDFRGIIDTMGQLISRRNMKWDMSYLYPGLQMHLSPSASPTGVLEFSLDQRREALNQYSFKEASTGRLLARQFLVPMLLGFKFNTVAIIPIIFGLLALLAKKAVFLSKIALIVSSAYGLGSLMFGNNGNRFPYHGESSGGHYGSYPHHPGLGLHGTTYNRFPDEEYFRVETKNDKVSYPETEPIAIHDAVHLQQGVIDNRHETSGRNFAWSDSEEDDNK